MGKNWKTGFQVGAAYIGAVMGAGFASGQELLQFFVAFKQDGLWGVALATLLFTLFGIGLLHLVYRLSIHSYRELLAHLFPTWLYKIFDILFSLSLLLGLCVMLAGAGALWAEHLGTSRWLGIGVTAGGVILVLLKQVRGILLVNTILVPIKLIVCLTVAILALGVQENAYSINTISVSNFLLIGGWPIASLLYVSFNLSLAAVVLAALGPRLAKEGRWLGGIIGGMGLGVFGFAICGALLQFYPQVTSYQVPMVFLAGQFHPYLQGAYILVLWLAMLTAAVGSAYGLAQRLSQKTGISLPWTGMASMILALPFIRYQFSDLVGTLYPLFGFLGLPLMAALTLRLINGFRQRLF